MNKERRKAIDKIGEQLSEIQAALVQLAEQEREYYDNMPENMQNGEKGEKADEVASALEESAEELESILDKLKEAVE